MIGSFHLSIKNKNSKYEFDINRNITIIRGGSGTGKTGLFNMIRDYNIQGKMSGISVSCDVPVIAYVDRNLDVFLKQTKHSIVIIDEENNSFIKEDSFLEKIKKTDNYYIIIARNYLPNIPYSVDEIYEIKGKRNKILSRLYSAYNLMYVNPKKTMFPFVPEVIITEDKKSGFQFFSRIAEKIDAVCVSSCGKSNIYEMLDLYKGKNVLIMADGAAFGPEIEDIAMKQRLSPNKIAICLPECFEWIILNSGILDRTDIGNKNIISEIIKHPEKYIDSKQYISWEVYFADLLIKSTKESKYCKYSKSKLTDFYCQDNSLGKIASVLADVKTK